MNNLSNFSKKPRFLKLISAALIAPMIHSTTYASVSASSSLLAAAPAAEFGKKSTPAFSNDQVNATGAFSYSYPLSFPDGRHGIKPLISISYSSDAPLRGGLAAGWALGIPAIKGDISKGSLDPNGNNPSEQHFVSTFMGGGKLIRQSGSPAEQNGVEIYYALHDNQYVRYERTNSTSSNAPFWRVRTPDGHVYEFGSPLYHEPYDARLIRQIDPFGHVIKYKWGLESFYTEDGRAYEPVLQGIYYQSHAGDTPYVEIAFNYSQKTCNGVHGFPVGAKLDYTLKDHSGTARLAGSQQLDSIIIKARRPEADTIGGLQMSDTLSTVRSYDFSYSEDTSACGANLGAPLRRLDSIQETAYAPVTGTVTALPPTTFNYGDFAPAINMRYQQTEFTNISLPKGEDLVHWGQGLPGVSTILADLNGDGLQDLLKRQVGSSDRDNSAEVFYNNGAGFNREGQTINFPEWLPDYVPDPDHPDFQNKSLGLAGQLKFYADHSDAYVNAACDFDVSKRNGSLEKFGLFDVNHDGLPDLVTSLHYDPERVSDRYLPSLPNAEQQQNFKALAIPQDPNLKICGLDVVRKRWPVWKVRYNLGGQFSTDIEMVHAPLALPAISAGFSIGSSNPSVIIERGGNGDFNGDGLQDRFDKGYLTPDDEDFHYDAKGFYTPIGDSDELEARKRWVMLGQPDGTLYRVTGHQWQLPKEWISAVKEFGSAAERDRYFATMTGLLDVNGDGLDDLVSTEHEAGTANWQFGYYPNNGQGFSEQMVQSSSNFTPDAAQYLSYSYSQISGADLQLPSAGVSESRIFPLDINLDGLTDLVKLHNGRIKVYANNGYKFSGTPIALRLAYDDGNGTMLERLRQSLRNLAYMGLDGPKTWLKANAYTDLNGDGLKDLVLIEDFNTRTLNAYIATLEQPPYRLTAITKPTGVVTQVDYTTSSSAETVTQGESDGDSYTVRNPRWLVKSITVSPGGQAAMRTEYSYRYPAFTADLYGKYALRGFKAINKRLPSGAVVESRYDFNAHYAGLLIEEVTYAAENFDVPHQIISYEYLSFPALHDTEETMLNAPFNWHEQVKTTYRCGTELPTGQDGESYCKNQGEKLRIGKAWTELDYLGDGISGETPATRVISNQVTSFNVAGELRAFYSPKKYTQRIDADEYLVRIILDTTRDYTNYPNNGEPRAFNQKLYRWSVDLKTLIIDKENIFEWDPVAKKNVRIGNKYARHSYDERGLLINSVSPREYPGGPNGWPGTSFEYDATGVTLTKTTNSLGHVLSGVVDIGTGATLLTEGPNATIDSNGNTVYERTRVVVDGLGRPQETYVSNDDAVSGYREVLLEKMSYDDQPKYHPGAYGIAVQQQKLVADAYYTNTLTVYDGLGRERVQRVDSEETEPALTHYFWDSAGQMIRMAVPDPATEGEQVSYEYAYDSLGRKVSVTGPGGLMLNTTRYEGLTEIRHEAGEKDAPAAEKRLTRNMAGQLIQVEELLDDGNFALTRYRYDAGGNISEIIDPEGVVTVLSHDSANRRRTIETGGRTWEYEYDLSDNLIAVINPHPEGEQAAYTTRFEYDILNRITKLSPARANLSDEEMAEFAIGETEYVYDQPHPSMGETTLNYVGRLGFSSSPVVSNRFRYDAQGAIIEHRQVLEVAGLGDASNSELMQSAAYHTDGSIAELSLRDPANNRSMVEALRYGYDSRGLPSRLETQIELAQLARNHAGKVTQRLSYHNGNTVSANYDYDGFGRLTSLRVYDAANDREPYSQQFDYYANSMVKTIQEKPADGEQRSMRFIWDTRHQLLQAVQDIGKPGYRSQFGYDRAGRLQHAEVVLSAGNPAVLKQTRVFQRAVDYQYDSTDPQRLDQLLNLDGSQYADYDYDASGNVIRRTLGKERWELRYDGENRLRYVEHYRAGKRLGQERYYYDGNTRVLAVNNDGKVRRWFGDAEVHYKNGAHEKDWYYAKLGQTVARIENGSEVEYTYQTPQGHEALSLKPDGTVQAGKLYGPFGELLYSELAPGKQADDYTREFNGKDYDHSSGLHYYGHRYYDPVALMWNRADPKYRFAPEQGYDQPRRMNLYAFTLNNPVSLVDPDGQDAVDIISMAFYDVKERVYKNPKRAIRKLPRKIRKQLVGRVGFHVIVQIRNQAGYDISQRYQGYINDAETVDLSFNRKGRKQLKRKGERKLYQAGKGYATFQLFYSAVTDALNMVNEELEEIKQELASIQANKTNVGSQYEKSLKKRKKVLTEDKKGLEKVQDDILGELVKKEDKIKDLYEQGKLWLDEHTDRKRL